MRRGLTWIVKFEVELRRHMATFGADAVHRNIVLST